MDMDLFQPDDIIPHEEGPGKLACSCPKCSAKIELELPEVLADETSVRSCPACKNRFVLTRESFARRATRKTGAINCAFCGGELSHAQYCPSCKRLYPEYFAAEAPDAAKKRSKQSKESFGWLKGISFEWQKRSQPTTEYHPVMAETDVWKEQESTAWNKRTIMIGVGTLVIIALIASGSLYYSHTKAKKQYAATYVMALYGIKMGSDLGIKLSKQVAADWNARLNAGQTSPARISVDDENKLNKIKSKTEGYLQKLSTPPDSYVEINEKLQKLNTLYSKVHTSVQNPSGSVTAFAETAQKTETEIQASIADLKKSLPPELTRELETAKTKYSGMSNI